MGVINTINTINSVEGTINRNYSLEHKNYEDIVNASSNEFEYIMNSFRFGYAQGMKAAKAEMKKGGVNNG